MEASSLRVQRLAPRALSAVAAVGIIGALVFTPLAFGGVEPWAFSVLAVLAYTALAASVARAVMLGTVRRLFTPLLIPAVLALLLVWLQYVEWPVGLLEKVSPGAVQARQRLASVTGGEVGGWVSPSLYPHATRSALIRLSAYIALFAAVCGYVGSWKEVTHLAAATVAVGFAASLLGLLQSFSGATKLYWWRELTHGGKLFGPFVSANQFATYAGMCMFMALGLFMAHTRRAPGLGTRRLGSAQRRAGSWAPQRFLAGFGALAIGSAVLWSLSRGGITSLFLALAGFMIALRVAGRVRTKTLYVVAAGVVALAAVIYLGRGPVFKRLSTLDEVLRRPSEDWRWRMSIDACRMGLMFPLLGTGAGTFTSVYPHYRTVPTNRIFSSPHNEYAHVLAEAGFVGLGLLFLVVALLFARILRGLVTRKDPRACAFLAGGVGALLMVGLHSIVDFPMRAPGIAATAAVLAALLYRAVGLRANTQEGREDHETANATRGLAAVILTAAAWILACNFALDALRGQLEGRAIGRAVEQVSPATKHVITFIEASEESIRAHSADDAQLYARLADLALYSAATWPSSQTAEDAVKRLSLADESLRLRTMAARLEPLNASHQFEIAMGHVISGRDALAVRHADFACELLPRDPWIRAGLAKGFLTYHRPDLAGDYLARAERLASAGRVSAAQKAIGRVRRDLGRARGTP